MQTFSFTAYQICDYNKIAGSEGKKPGDSHMNKCHKGNVFLYFYLDFYVRESCFIAIFQSD